MKCGHIFASTITIIVLMILLKMACLWQVDRLEKRVSDRLDRIEATQQEQLQEIRRARAMPFDKYQKLGPPSEDK